MSSSGFTTRTWIAIALYPMVNAVLFGAVAVTVLTLGQSTSFIVPLMVPGIVAMLVLAIPVGWLLAPRLRYRMQR